MGKEFITKEQVDFCKDCFFRILVRVAITGSKFYGCKVGIEPRLYRGKLACRYKKK